MTLVLHQLLGRHCYAGVRYQLSDASLHDVFPEIPTTVSAVANASRNSVLHHVRLQTGLNHPNGLFASAGADWYAQTNTGYNAGAVPGDDFWQFNLHAGWRFSRRRAQLELGLLNLANQDYRLYPLNSYADLPRSRTLAVSIKLNF